MKLPKRYIPKSLRKESKFSFLDFHDRNYTVYGIGIESSRNNYGMTHGPVISLDEMLDVVPDCNEKNVYIIRFNRYGTEDVIYKWRGSDWFYIGR